MENSAQTPENKPMPQDPKPGDDVQMHIETVIPEGENEIEATGDTNSKSETFTSENEPTDNSDETAKAEQPTEEIAEEKDDDATEPTDESEENAQPSNDERDKIETISP